MAVLRRKGGPKPFYGITETDKLTIKVHHGGHIVFDYGGLRYAGGEIRYFDWVSRNRVNLNHLLFFGNQLGYPMDLEMDYWYNKLTNRGDLLEFRPIFTNEDVLRMCLTLDEEGVACLYMVQPTTLGMPVDYTNSVNNHVSNTHSAIIISDTRSDTKAEEGKEDFEEVQGNEILHVHSSTDLSSNDVHGNGFHGNVANLSDQNPYSDTFQNNQSQRGRPVHGSCSNRRKSIWDVNNSPLHDYTNLSVDESDASVNLSLTTMASRAK